MKGQSVEIKLLGQRIGLRSSETDPELVREVVSLVSQKIKEAENRAKAPVAHQVVLVALMDIAEEYIKAKNRTRDFKAQFDQKATHLLRMLEEELK